MQAVLASYRARPFGQGASRVAGGLVWSRP